MIEWIGDHLEWIGILTVICLIATIYFGIKHSEERKERACRSLLRIAPNAHDTLLVRMKCDVSDDQQVIPVYIPINVGH